MLAPPQPPDRATRFRSDDPDEVTSRVAASEGFHSRVVHGTGAYGYEAAKVIGGDVSLGWVRTIRAHTVRGRLPVPTVHIPIQGAQRYHFGRQTLDVAPGQPLFIPPGTEVGRHSGPASIFGIVVDATSLAADLQSRTPDSALASPERPMLLELSAAPRAAMQNAIAGLVCAVDADALLSKRRHCEARFIGLLAEVLAPEAASGQSLLTARRLIDLEEWIEAHLTDPITIGRLCAVAGVGERSLQLGFRTRRGMSPLRFVFERRLAAAHRRLAMPDGDEDITAIAHDLGFNHLGRFSIAYRQAYGESPSSTRLRRRRTADGAQARCYVASGDAGQGASVISQSG